MNKNEIDKEEITLDNWKPNPPNKKLIQSEWRKNQIGENYNQEVFRDDLKKIQTAIQKKFPDHEIMQTYGINAQTLVDIKERRINPGNGIIKGSLCTGSDVSDFGSIKKTISAIQTRLYGIGCAFRELAKILFEDKETQEEFLKLLEKKRGKVKSRNKDDEEE
jgi:hypothetical protein